MFLRYFYSDLGCVKYHAKVIYYLLNGYVLGLIPVETVDVREAASIPVSTSLSRYTFGNNLCESVM